MEISPIIGITGEKGSGKTSLCEWCASEYRSRGFDVAGIISPGSFVDGEKKKILAKDIRSGDTRVLAEKLTQLDTSSITPAWEIVDSTLDWGNNILKNSVPCDLLIIDELGQLELIYRKGWMSAFQILEAKRFHLALVVVRSQMLSKAKEILGDIIVFEVSGKDPSLNQQRIEKVMSETLRSRKGEH